VLTKLEHVSARLGYITFLFSIITGVAFVIPVLDLQIWWSLVSLAIGFLLLTTSFGAFRMQMNGKNKRRKILYLFVIYAIFVSAVGMFSYHHSDANSYFSMISVFYGEGTLYSNPAPSYFPLPYFIMAIFLFPIHILGLSVSPTWYSLFAVNILFALSLALLAYFGYSNSEVFEGDEIKEWILFILINPLTIIGVYVWGQSDALVALGVGAAVIAATRKKWALFGAGTVFGATIKIYPALMLVPPFIRRPEARKDILKGALPVIFINLLLLTVDYKSAISAFLNPEYSFGLRSGRSGITESHPAWIVGYLTPIPAEQLAGIIFFISVGLVVLWALFGDFEIESLRSVVVLCPMLLTYPTLYTYRWLPVIIAIAWLGYTQAGLFRLKIYAWGASILGACYLFIQILLGSLSSTPIFDQTIGIYLPKEAPLTAGTPLPVLSIIFVGVANWVLFIWAFYPIILSSLRIFES